MCRFFRVPYIPYLNAFLAFTAYSLTTTSSVSGHCVTHTNSPIPLFAAYTVNIAADIDFDNFLPTSTLQPLTDVANNTAQQSSIFSQRSRLAQDGYSSFLDDAYSSFLTTKGLRSCTASIPPSQTIPKSLGSEAVIPAAATSAGSSTTSAGNSTASSTPGRRVHSPQLIILSVVLPTVGIIVLLICFIIVRRYRRKRSQTATSDHPETISNTQLYVDQKAELEDDKRGRYELEAVRKTHEMDGEDTVFEIPGNRNSRMQLPSSHGTHELRGPDHSQELEVPRNI